MKKCIITNFGVLFHQGSEFVANVKFEALSVDESTSLMLFTKFVVATFFFFLHTLNFQSFYANFEF